MAIYICGARIHAGFLYLQAVLFPRASQNMMRLCGSYLSEFGYSKLAKATKQQVPNYVYRDELDKKAAKGKLERRADGHESKPLLEIEEEERRVERTSNGCSIEKKGGLRVKILMTKGEAARLLSKCKDGGVLEFKDVACELVNIPATRVSVSGAAMD